MSATRHVSVKMNPAELLLIDFLRDHYSLNTRSQTLRKLVRDAARGLGLAAADFPPLPPPGRPRRTKEAKSC